MDRLWTFCVVTITAAVFKEATSLNIRNEQFRECVQVQEGRGGRNRLALGECSSDFGPQEWQWNPETYSLISLQTGECLTALKAQEHESVKLHACGVEDLDREGQTWSCSKKGHITLHGKNLHLSAKHDSGKIFLSKDRGRASKWKTLLNQTVCGLMDSGHSRHLHGHTHGAKQMLWTASPFHSRTQSPHTPLYDGEIVPEPMDMNPFNETQSGMTSDDLTHTMTFFSMEYGMGWKVAMVVLSSLALVLGLIILILNIYQNRKKKTVVILKSYTPSGEASQAGSPVTSERAPLTKHPAKPPHSPSLQHGEILIEWKDGTVTPLFDNNR